MSVKEFLDSVAKDKTKTTYEIGINRFCEWFKRNPEEVLNLRKQDLTQRPGEDLITYRNRAARFEKEIEAYHSHLLKQGYKTNSARTLTGGIRQLFRYYQMPVRMRSGSRVNRGAKTTRNFLLRIDHVRRMYKVADLRERVILTLATDLGLRIGDFLNIRKQDLPPLNQEPPISFNLMTGKEEVIAYGFLSEESVEQLKLYLPTLPKDNPYLFPSNGSGHLSDEWINELLRKTVIKAGIETKSKHLTFHCFRKMFLSSSIDSGVGLTAGKKMCGKSIAQSDDTYLTTVKLREKFKQLKKFLRIRETVSLENHEKVEAFRSIVTKLQQELSEQKLITQTVTEESLKIKKELQILNDIINPLQPMLEFVNSFESADAMIEFLQAIEERSATARQRVETMAEPIKMAREIFKETIRDIMRKETQRVKRHLSKKTGITQEDILQAAIQAAKESIEEEYGIKIGDGKQKKQTSI